jgi:hypothetical protein
MITLNKATSINVEAFDTLFAASYNTLSEEGFWEMTETLKYKRLMTYDERRDDYLESLTWILDNDLDTDFVIEFKDDGNIIGLAGAQDGSAYDNESYIRLGSFLTAPDNNGSTTWVFSEDYIRARTVFWDEIGINAWIEVNKSINSRMLELANAYRNRIERHCTMEVYEEPYKIPIQIGTAVINFIASQPIPAKIKYTKLES